MEVEVNSTHPFLDVLVMKRGPNLATKGYRKPNHTGRYPHFKSNHPIMQKEESPRTWSLEPRSCAKIRTISTSKLIKDMI
jgi:hypothetical protein